MLFKEIIGQISAKAKLIQTVVSGRISHAQLFLGPEGSGKLALAIAYAQYISCENRSETDSCGKCSSCIKYQNLAHPDLHFIYPVATTKKVSKDPISARFSDKWREAILENPYLNLNQWYAHIGIQNKQGIINALDCNEIIKKLSLKTFESEYKVMIIWRPERLFHSAAPKLLKILEEPPPNTVFLLVAENQDQIIKTILSRTQLVKINKISDKHLYDELSEKFNLHKEDIERAVRLSFGNYATALQVINEQLLNDGETQKEDTDLINFQKWMRVCFIKDVLKIVDWVEEVSKIGRESQKNFIAYGLKIIRECLLLNHGVNDLVRLSDDELDFAQKFAPFVNSSNCFEMTGVLNKAHQHIERNANPRILFFDVSLKFSGMLKK